MMNSVFMIDCDGQPLEAMWDQATHNKTAFEQRWHACAVLISRFAG